MVCIPTGIKYRIYAHGNYKQIGFPLLLIIFQTSIRPIHRSDIIHRPSTMQNHTNARDPKLKIFFRVFELLLYILV